MAIETFAGAKVQQFSDMRKKKRKILILRRGRRIKMKGGEMKNEN